MLTANGFTIEAISATDRALQQPDNNQ